jgi:hypothetical protein
MFCARGEIGRDNRYSPDKRGSVAENRRQFAAASGLVAKRDVSFFCTAARSLLSFTKSRL